MTGAAAAVARFLAEVVPAKELRRADVQGTPLRVAEAFRDDLLDGYGQDPARILGQAMEVPGRDLVALAGIDFHAVCPHHLLPYRGTACVAYVPAGRVVGFGLLARLVDCFAHRLVIQEVLARQVADALVEHLGARLAATLAPDGEAHLLGVENAGGPARAEVLHQRVGDLPRQHLLDHQPVGEAIDEPGQQSESHHPPVRDVGHAGLPAIREEVVRTDGVEVDPGQGHQVAARDLHGLPEDPGGVLPVAVEQVVAEGLGHPPWRALDVGPPELVRGDDLREEPCDGGCGRSGRRSLPSAHRDPGR